MTIAELFAKIRASISGEGAALQARADAVVARVEHEVSMIGQAFAHKFADAKLIETEVVHQAEKDIEMVSQIITDAVARITKLISDLQGQNSSLSSAAQAKDAQIADLTSKLSDATSQLNDTQALIAGIVPAAPPQDQPAPAVQ